MNTLYAVLMLLSALIASCGSNESGNGPATNNSPDPSTQNTAPTAPIAEPTQTAEKGSTEIAQDADPVNVVVPAEKTPPPSPNIWHDMVDDNYWLIAGTGTYPQAMSACTDEYSAPNKDQLLAAVTHGLGAFAKSVNNANGSWASDYSGQHPVTHIDYYSRVMYLPSVFVSDDPANHSYGIVCLWSAQ